jgi:hypothetical protein
VVTCPGGNPGRPRREAPHGSQHRVAILCTIRKPQEGGARPAQHLGRDRDRPIAEVDLDVDLLTTAKVGVALDEHPVDAEGPDQRLMPRTGMRAVHDCRPGTTRTTLSFGSDRHAESREPRMEGTSQDSPLGETVILVADRRTRAPTLLAGERTSHAGLTSGMVVRLPRMPAGSPGGVAGQRVAGQLAPQRAPRPG